MNDPAETSSSESDSDEQPVYMGMLKLAIGLWIFGTLMSLHTAMLKPNPCPALNSTVPLNGLPFVTGAFSLLIAGLWSLLRLKPDSVLYEITFLSTLMIVGLFMPTLLEILFRLFIE